MRKVVAAIAAFLVGLSIGLSIEVVTYDAQNAGILFRVKEVPVCVGFETRGVVGFFGGRYDACDI